MSISKVLDNAEIEEYEFLSFDGMKVDIHAADKVTDFEIRELDVNTPQKREEHQKTIKIERDFAEKKNFQISPIVQAHRGIMGQEENERERRIKEEVERNLANVREEAFEKGYQDGIEAGKAEVYEQMKELSEEKISRLTDIITEVMNEKEALLQAQKQELYGLIKNLTKWVVLRELEEDGDYIKRLLEKLITEINTKQNLLIQVNQRQFDEMPDVLEFVQNKIGELRNVRVEVDYDISDKGIVIDSENGIIKGTMEEQFSALDKLFEAVGIEEDESDQSA